MKVQTGVEGFDSLCSGGLPAGRAYIVSGAPGCGKTTFGIQFLTNGASFGDVGLYLTLLETSDDIVANMSGYDMNLEALIKMKKVLFSDLSPDMEYGYIDELQEVISPELAPSYAPIENDAPSAATVFKEIASYVESYDVKRLVIDPVSAIRFAAKDACMKKKEMARFIRNLKRLGCTVMMLTEGNNVAFEAPQYCTADGIILLESPDENLASTIQIMKIRGSRHSSEKVPFIFGEQGITLEK
ncbi:KaiC/GvpD/RAD55 family RecA-like ATPase [Methanohalophilus levihalophilus]|uniref:RAD55 family ATPase n=1 Tax=Methanohalophilus levihalophilus TaxID=1431282 RepID=UPI001AE51E6F|nr:ATPase domain-containing protein [Methanohalophilus levihalophilus]MBP2029927.1 KaiC/GvpD/RAD55 family RecA-like ATPase [Methanohalophilus levihalophilus]